MVSSSSSTLDSGGSGTGITPVTKARVTFTKARRSPTRLSNPNSVNVFTITWVVARSPPCVARSDSAPSRKSSS